MGTTTAQSVEGVTVEVNVAEITPEFLKEAYLQGLDFVDKQGKPIPDAFFIRAINSAIAQFERITKVMVVRRTIVDEPHDYYINDYATFAFIQLFNYPVIDPITAISAVYPTGQLITQFPVEWVRLTANHGQVQLVPTQGTLSQVILGQGGSYLPLIYNGLSYLPQLFRVSYTTGFPDGKIPYDILDAIGKLATINILGPMGEQIFPVGVTNISAGIDGLSQGIGIAQNPNLPGVFAGRISLYRTELFGDPKVGDPGMLKNIKDEFRGITMAVM